MGDVSPPSGLGNDYSAQPAPVTAPRPAAAPSEFQDAAAYSQSQGQGVPDPQAAYYSPPHHQQQQYGGQQQAYTTPYDMAQQQALGRGGPYNMGALMNALPPQTNFRPGQGQAQTPGQMPRYNAPPGHQQPMPQAAAAYVGAAAMHAMAAMPGQQYYMPHQGPMPQFYGGAMPASQHQQQPQQQPQDPVRANMAFYQQAAAPSHAQYYYPHGSHYANQAAVMQNPMVGGQYMAQQPGPHGDPRQQQQQQQQQQQHNPPVPMQQSQGGGGGATFAQTRGGHMDGVQAESRSNVVRGPPRKPRQSGHAIWIGNLPPQTDLMSLVYHVCKEAPGLESLFLISKSNCAFANFKDEQTCISAQQSLHDSKFQSVRLVSRLRKSTVEGATGVTAPTGPASSSAAAAASAQRAAASQDDRADVLSASDKDDRNGGEASGVSIEEEAATTSRPGPATSAIPEKDKYFILKSLTVEDLELSVHTGIWATQSHNETSLNDAFRAADNVYLIFSANKSGEYFGYARMTSPINEDPAAAIEFAPKAQSASDIGLPKAIPTEATEHAPRGSIMDDSERGTIFWEADLSAEDAEDNTSAAGGGGGGADGDAADDSGSAKSGGGGGPPGSGPESKAWGKPFQLEWLSTARLPFYRARGLRNPWNSNREVKIARDGTELEPTIGRKLTSLFPPRAVQSGSATAMRQSVPMPMGMVVPGGGGVAYVPMRPSYQP